MTFLERCSFQSFVPTITKWLAFAVTTSAPTVAFSSLQGYSEGLFVIDFSFWWTIRAEFILESWCFWMELDLSNPLFVVVLLLLLQVVARPQCIDPTSYHLQTLCSFLQLLLIQFWEGLPGTTIYGGAISWVGGAKNKNRNIIVGKWLFFSFSL